MQLEQEKIQTEADCLSLLDLSSTNLPKAPLLLNQQHYLVTCFLNFHSEADKLFSFHLPQKDILLLL